MINKHIMKILKDHDNPIMIPSENVATVRSENSLLHATMILSNVGYSSIPVVDDQHHLLGIITLPRIIDGIKDNISYNWDLLSEKKVEEIICDDCSVTCQGKDMEEVLRLLVDHNYVNVVDENHVFQGIITRKAVLQRLNHLLHQIDIELNIQPK